mmetsp:Transcript_147970/g.475128  ORF Transcript_147970/g.475128 Transcript_147970/m.475128 type:complete len:81 (-) Transcript_147970:235-477(-)
MIIGDPSQRLRTETTWPLLERLARYFRRGAKTCTSSVPHADNQRAHQNLPDEDILRETLRWHTRFYVQRLASKAAVGIWP